jgi:hypothetical protein
MAKKSKDIEIALKDLMESSSPEETRDNKKSCYSNDKSGVIGIRFLLTDRGKLENHFKLKGIISLSVGIREIIYKYMQLNNLL